MSIIIYQTKKKKKKKNWLKTVTNLTSRGVLGDW